jgi:hypothetical protein
LLTRGEIEQARQASNAFDRQKCLKICKFIVGPGLA